MAPFGGRRADATLMDWRGGAPSWIHRSFCDISDVPQIFRWISETISAFKVKLRLKSRFRFGVGMRMQMHHVNSQIHKLVLFEIDKLH